MSIGSTSTPADDIGQNFSFTELFLLGRLAFVVAIAVAGIGGVLLCLLLALMAAAAFSAQSSDAGIAFVIGAALGLLAPGATAGASLLWVRHRVKREAIRLQGKVNLDAGR